MATIEARKDEEATIKVASTASTSLSNKKSSTPSKPPSKLSQSSVNTGNRAFNIRKPSPQKQSKPGNWKESFVFEEDKSKPMMKDKENIVAASSPPSPVINAIHHDDSRETFLYGRPLDDIPELQQCKHCKKGVTKVAAKDHITKCLRIKKEKAQRKKEAREARERQKEAALRDEEMRKIEDNVIAKGGIDSDSDDDDDKKTIVAANAGKTTKKATGKKTDVGSKKRKAETELEKGKSKKKKEDPKGGKAKPKGPVDVERQCGVILPTGLPCARSLTCKSHSMSAKRSVPGRSLPYDMLLMAYQKKNQAKQQKAAIDANAPLEDEDEVNAAVVDSDEETAAVMAALARWNPQPVVPQPVFAPIKRTYQLARLHEQLQTATNGGRVNIFKVNGFGAQRLPENHPALFDNEDAPGEPDIIMTGTGDFSRRSSSFSLSGPPQRRPSVSSRA
ncbi:SCA7, zinc-binding domain-containing protein [Podospora australis]|uniref:SCA7, zinc-binding domain-containing protein n=1 Tax=Podospora australis TaxID=1536484 RepID=A0AAN6X3B3_9PEZI|nr:SCA7, zinc-binding domain-containing protein [Podospora australis]